MDPHFSSLTLALVALAGGLLLLVLGGELLVAGSVRLARALGMSKLLVGLTVVAFGTSTPELFVSLAAALKGHPGIMLGNVLGSNIANIALVLAIAALLADIPVRFAVVAREFYLLLAASGLLALLAVAGRFPRWAGLLFVAALVGYTVQAYQRRRKERQQEAARPKVRLPLAVVQVAGGLLLLALGSDWFIAGAVDVAVFFGVSKLVIGLTLAAIGTSLPELASSIAAVRHRQSQLLVGNIIGSNLFNLLMVMGMTGIVTPFTLPAAVLHRDLPVMVAFSLLLLIIIVKRRQLNRWHGLLLLAGYGGYLAWLAASG